MTWPGLKEFLEDTNQDTTPEYDPVEVATLLLESYKNPGSLCGDVRDLLRVIEDLLEVIDHAE